MKILILFPHFISPGGAATTLLKYANELQLRGHEIEIVCARVSKEVLEENSMLKFKELNVPISSSFFYWVFFPFWQLKINRILKDYKDYVFYPHVLPSNWWAWIFKLTHKNSKIVWHCHEPSAFIHSNAWINAIHNPLMRLGAKLANPFLKRVDLYLEKKNNLVYCNSKFVMTEYEKVYKGRANALIYPPIIIKNISPNPNRKKQILSVSRLTKFKQVDILIDAFVLISKKFPDYHLIIIGEGEEKENLRNKIIEHNQESKIHLVGKISNIELEEYFLTSKATVMCSENEPFGLVPVESMMYGTPVIAHNSGGPKETIVHEKTGLLFHNKDDLTKALEKIINFSEEDYSKIQVNCLEHVRIFNLSESINKLEKLFLSVKL
ncbi:MAG TPA: glycosyltransferase family 4 protein [Chitinophagaceae bacterium]